MKNRLTFVFFGFALVHFSWENALKIRETMVSSNNREENSNAQNNLPSKHETQYLSTTTTTATTTTTTTTTPLQVETCADKAENQKKPDSGIYELMIQGQPRQVYCEFREDHGYVFIETQTLNYLTTEILDKLATDKSRVLFKFKYPNTHYEVVIQQLPQYAHIPFSFQINEYNGYTKPKDVSTPYLYFGILPASLIKQGTTQGYRVDNDEYTFTNCDNNTNSYFVFYPGEGSGDLVKLFPGIKNRLWIDDRKAASLKLGYHNFFRFDEHLGGCEVFFRSTGGALGLRFDLPVRI